MLILSLVIRDVYTLPVLLSGWRFLQVYCLCGCVWYTPHVGCDLFSHRPCLDAYDGYAISDLVMLAYLKYFGFLVLLALLLLRIFIRLVLLSYPFYLFRIFSF